MTPPSASMSGAVLGVDVPGKYEGGWAVVNIATERVLARGPIRFDEAASEKTHYRRLGVLFDRLTAKYGVVLAGLEHPFLYLIAQRVGAVKMWAARKRDVRWYMLTASSAKKAVLGDGKLGKGAKAEVLAYVWARTEPPRVRLTQHEADAILYALAVIKKLKRGEIPGGV